MEDKEEISFDFSKPKNDFLDQDVSFGNLSSIDKDRMEEIEKEEKKRDLDKTPLPIFECIYCCSERVVFDHLISNNLTRDYLLVCSPADAQIIRDITTNTANCSQYSAYLLNKVVENTDYVRTFYDYHHTSKVLKENDSLDASYFPSIRLNPQANSGNIMSITTASKIKNSFSQSRKMSWRGNAPLIKESPENSNRNSFTNLVKIEELSKVQMKDLSFESKDHDIFDPDLSFYFVNSFSKEKSKEVFATSSVLSANSKDNKIENFKEKLSKMAKKQVTPFKLYNLNKKKELTTEEQRVFKTVKSNKTIRTKNNSTVINFFSAKKTMRLKEPTQKKHLAFAVLSNKSKMDSGKSMKIEFTGPKQQKKMSIDTGCKWQLHAG